MRCTRRAENNTPTTASTVTHVQMTASQVKGGSSGVQRVRTESGRIAASASPTTAPIATANAGALRRTFMKRRDCATGIALRREAFYRPPAL